MRLKGRKALGKRELVGQFLLALQSPTSNLGSDFDALIGEKNRNDRDVPLKGTLEEQPKGRKSRKNKNETWLGHDFT
jgi:hypothetical protein